MLFFFFTSCCRACNNNSYVAPVATLTLLRCVQCRPEDSSTVTNLHARGAHSRAEDSPTVTPQLASVLEGSAWCRWQWIWTRDLASSYTSWPLTTLLACDSLVVFTDGKMETRPIYFLFISRGITNSKHTKVLWAYCLLAKLAGCNGWHEPAYTMVDKHGDIQSLQIDARIILYRPSRSKRLRELML